MSVVDKLRQLLVDSSAPKGVLEAFDAAVKSEQPADAASTTADVSAWQTPCPSCGTRFATGKEPWLQQKLHCVKHDMLYTSGSVCSGCEGEFGHDAAVERAASDVQAKADAIASIPKPV